MTGYFLRRLLLVIPTFLGVTLLVFTLTRLVPGGPIERMMNQAMMANTDKGGGGQRGLGGGALSEAQMNELKAYYGFDKPIALSYLDWLGKVLRLNLGTSTRYNEPVLSTITSRLPVTVAYGLISLIFTYAVSVPLAIAKAIRHRTLFDDASSALVFIGYALPSYVVAIVLLVWFAFNLEWFPLSGFVSDDYSTLSTLGRIKDLFTHAVLPMIAYTAGAFAFSTFMMKNALMDNLAADYVRTAVAKGLTFRDAVYKHAFRNGLIPVATSIGGNISGAIAGSFLIERIFNIDGFGLLGFESLTERDYPVVMGILVISAVIYLLGNILSDICVALVDPRVKFGSAG